MANGEANMTIPPAILKAAGAMILATIVFALVARTTDIGAVRLTPEEAVKSVELHVQKAANGDISITDAVKGTTLDLLPAKSDNFVKVVLRSVDQERNVKGVGADQPFRLSRLKNDQILFEDLGTGRVLILSAFGGGNAAQFSRYLD